MPSFSFVGGVLRRKPISRIFKKPADRIGTRVLQRVEAREIARKRVWRVKPLGIPTGIVIAVLTTTKHGYPYYYKKAYYIKPVKGKDPLERIREVLDTVRLNPNTIDFWVFSTHDVMRNRLHKKLKAFQRDLRRWLKRLGKILYYKGGYLTPSHIRWEAMDVKIELHHRIIQAGATIHQRQITDWDGGVEE